jgi:DNA-directed RNA polymerase subunit RPC12/RpoP
MIIMSNVSRVIGTIEIECPKCKNMTSYRKILFDNAGEFGECMKCGGLTYTKVINGISKNPQNPSGVKCPYCDSKNVKKISELSKFKSIFVLGLFSNKINKQWHCNDCKSNF